MATKPRRRKSLVPLSRPEDLVVDGVDFSMEVQHPRSKEPHVTITGLLQPRINQMAEVMDQAFKALQTEAHAASLRKDAVAVTLINGKLLDHTAKILTSPAAMQLRPEAATYDLDQFTSETREMLLAAFAAAERELRAKEETHEGA